MRTVPQGLKLALEDASLPVKKRVFMSRRVWDAGQSKYVLENEPLDVTGDLVEMSQIKLALDNDEADKWDASNVTLTFHNELNRFKEGLSGGLFENAVLWGSKFEVMLGCAGANAPQEEICVFTGYVYTSPVLRENGNKIELTVTSSLDALEYVSAEDFCLIKRDEEAAEVQTDNDKNKGKEFVTLQTGVGYVDAVKYGQTLSNALTLSAGQDYDVSDLNQYDKPAAVNLQFTPTPGYKMWISYRYWHKDMKIEDIVNALLDLAGVDKRNVEKAVFALEMMPVAYFYPAEENLNTFLMQSQTDGEENSFSPRVCGQWGEGGAWNCGRISYAKGTTRCESGFWRPQKEIVFLVDALRAPGASDASYCEGITDENGRGLCIGSIRKNGASTYFLSDPSWLDLEGRKNMFLNSSNANDFAGFSLAANGDVYVYKRNGAYLSRYFWKNYDFTPSKIILRGWKYTDPYVQSGDKIFILPAIPTDAQLSACSFEQLTSGPEVLFKPSFSFQASSAEGFAKWGKLTALITQEQGGYGTFYYKDSDDGINYSAPKKINLEENIPSAKPFIRIVYQLDCPYDKKTYVQSLRLSQYLQSTNIPLVNLSDLTVAEAVAQLAKMVSYEIGFDQDGVFFFRSRSGKYADVELDSSRLLEVDNHSADIDSLVNRVSVEYGNFKTTVDDFTEGKPRPHTIDAYGVHSKEISDDNFIPADNVDISRAVAKANYDALCVPGHALQVDCRPDLSLELGDKITVCSENKEIASSLWSNLHKFLKLPAWKRVFKVRGIELDVDKRLMTLELKDVTTENDIPPMEYENYQTVFPTPLNYKE